MFPHTVTVYNTTIERDMDTLAETFTHNITILTGVLLDETKAYNVRASGLEGADAATLYIPYSAKATDGITGEPKRYVPPVEFWKADNQRGLWTMSPDGGCFFVKGVAVHPEWNVQTIEAAHDSVYDITKVDAKDYSGDMSHWEVGGK